MNPARLVELHGKAQVRFQRRILVGDVVAPMTIGFFDAQRIQRVIAGVGQAEACARCDDGVVDADRELCGTPMNKVA